MNEANAIVSAMTSAISTISSDALSGIAAIVPTAAPVMGGLVLIGVCVRTMKRFFGK